VPMDQRLVGLVDLADVHGGSLGTRGASRTRIGQPVRTG
jgi:hypothetical protein